MVLFQQWSEEYNSGPVGHFLPTTILQQPTALRKKKKANKNKRLNELTWILGLHFV